MGHYFGFLAEISDLSDMRDAKLTSVAITYSAAKDVLKLGPRVTSHVSDQTFRGIRQSVSYNHREINRFILVDSADSNPERLSKSSNPTSAELTVGQNQVKHQTSRNLIISLSFSLRVSRTCLLPNGKARMALRHYSN